MRASKFNTNYESGNSSSSSSDIVEEDAVQNDAAMDDSDDELQVAFREGLLQKHGITIPQTKKREPIYKKEEMLKKLNAFRKKQDWLNTLHVKFSPDLCYDTAVDMDFEREAAFYKQALNATQLALPRLKALNVPTARPADYFAEMAKTDQQMDRVRKRLLGVQKRKETQANSRRLREEKKFAVKVQRSREDRKRKEKKKLLDATKKHRKGMKGQLEDMLKNAKRMQRDEEEEPSSFVGGGFRKGGGKSRQQQQRLGKLGKRKMSRTNRDKKFGFGGQKKRSKKNDRTSFNAM